MLSLAAEVLWLSIDPASGRLLSHRRRLRQCLQPSGLRAARSELVDAGLVAPSRWRRRLMLVDRPAAVRRFKQVSDAVAANDPSDPRIRDIAVLLAASGALAARLSHEERMVAYRRLRHVMDADESGSWRPAFETQGGVPVQVTGQLGAWILASLGAGLVHHPGSGGSDAPSNHYGGGGGAAGGGGGGGPTWGPG